MAVIRSPRVLLALACACAAAFGALLAVSYGVGWARWADGAALQGFLGLNRPLVRPVADTLAHLADPLSYGLLGGALILVALARQRPRHALAVAVLLAATGLTTQLLKPLLAWPRHHDLLGFSQIKPEAFPSGHATAAMALALAAVLVSPLAFRAAAAALGGAFALAVSFSILILGWHFPSDVVGGFLVSTTWCLVLLACLRAAAARWPEHSGRDAARRAIEVPAARAAIGSIAVAVAGIGLAALPLLPRAMEYAGRHTAFALVAAAIPVAAAALLGAVTVAATRR